MVVGTWLSGVGWRKAEMALRWTAAGMLEARETFRRLKACRHPSLPPRDHMDSLSLNALVFTPIRKTPD